MLYVIDNTGQKIRGTKFLPTRPGGEIGENFLLVKISSYTVLFVHIQYMYTSFIGLPCSA